MKKIIGAILIIFLIILILIFSFADSFVPGNVSKVTINGEASYNPIFGWSVEYDDFTASEETWLPFEAIWETGQIHIKVAMVGAGTYNGEQKVGTVSTIIGGTKNFNVPLRYVKSGTYSGTIECWEVKHDPLIPILETSREMQATTTFQAVIP